MNKQGIMLLLSLLSGLMALGQNVMEPPIIRWDTSSLQLGSTLLYRDTNLVMIGSDYAQGQFIGELNDSLEVGSKVYVNSNLGVVDADYRFGSYYIGGIRATGSGTTSLAMDRITLTGEQAASARANFDGIFDYAHGITPTQDSGAVVFGMGSPPRVINLCKFDRNGGIVWNRKFTTTSDCYANDILELEHGSLLVTGQASGFPDSARGVTLLKLTEKGDSVWAKNYATPGASGRKIFKSSHDHVFVAGTAYKSLTAFINRPFLYLSRIDSSGNLDWEITYDRFVDDPVLEFSFEDAKPTSDGGVIFLGTISLDNDSIQGERSLLLKVDAQGAYQWHKLILPENGDKCLGGEVLPLRNGTYALLLLGKPQVGNFYMIYALLGPDGTFTDVPDPRPALAFTASPNPTSDLMTLDWQQPQAGQAHIELLDLQGRVLFRSSQLFPAGQAQFSLSLNEYPAGNYLIRIHTDGRQSSTKVVKQE